MLQRDVEARREAETMLQGVRRLARIGEGIALGVSCRPLKDAQHPLRVEPVIARGRIRFNLGRDARDIVWFVPVHSAAPDSWQPQAGSTRSPDRCLF